MNMQLKQALEKCNVLKKVEIYSKSYGYQKDTDLKKARFEGKMLQNEWRPLANT